METNKERAEALEKKVENLERIFNTADKTIIEIECSKNDVITDDFDELTMLKQDFQIIRSTVISTIEKANRVVTALTPNIELDPTASGSLISSYAELVNTINNSAKMLSDLYKNLVEIKKKAEISDMPTKADKQQALSVGEITRLLSKNN